MRKILPIVSCFILLAASCSRNHEGTDNPVVRNSIDSIRKYCTRELRGTHEQHEFVYLDEECWGERRKQWIFADSIDKYCSVEDLKSLAATHGSNTIRIVAFQLLAKRSQHEAAQVFIADIDNNDTIGCGRVDEVLDEPMAGIMARVIFDLRHDYHLSEADSLAVDNAIRESPSYAYYEQYVKFTTKQQ